MNDMSINAVAVANFAAIKQRQQATWASGDYAVVGTTLQIVGESLAEAADVRADERVLDVAAGNGNATLAAARRFAQVTSTDTSRASTRPPARAPKGSRCVSREAMSRNCRSRTSSTSCLDLRNVCLTTPHRAKRCVLTRRLTGMANGRGGFHRPAVQGDRCACAAAGGLKAPAWAARPPAELFGPLPRTFTVKHFNFRYRSAAHWVQVFRDFHGPTHKAFAALDASGQQALERDLTALLAELNVASEPRWSCRQPEIVITKH
jgi:hypothetical protein